MAISGVTPALPLRRLFRACRLTRRTLAAAVTVSPSGTRQSCLVIFPGRTGRFMGISILLPNRSQPRQRRKRGHFQNERRYASWRERSRTNIPCNHPYAGADDSLEDRGLG